MTTKRHKRAEIDLKDKFTKKKTQNYQKKTLNDPKRHTMTEKDTKWPKKRNRMTTERH